MRGVDGTEFERGDDAEVAPAAAPQGPEQVRVLVGGRDHRAAVGEDDPGRDDPVARHPELPGLPAQSAAAEEPALTDRGKRAGDDLAVVPLERVERVERLDALPMLTVGPSAAAWFIRDRSMTRPVPVDQPLKLWLKPPRTCAGMPASRAWRTQARTSSGDVQ